MNGVLTILLTLLAASPAFTQGSSDLSGTWVMDASKTVAPPGTPRGSTVPVTIRQTAAAVEIQRPGQTLVCRLSGTPIPSSDTRQEVPAVWDGKRLVISPTGKDSKQPVVRWYIEGEFLVNEVGDGASQVKRYFRRAQAPLTFPLSA